MSEISFYNASSLYENKELHHQEEILKLLKIIIQEILSEEHLDPILKQKVNNILLKTDFQGIFESIFDIKCNEEDKLARLEQIELRKLVHEKIKRLAFENSTICSKNQENNYEILCNMVKKLNTNCNDYLNNLEDFKKLLEEFIEMQKKKVPELCNTKLKNLRLMERITDTKAYLLEQRVKVDALKENDISLQAYKELNKDVQKQINQFEQKKKDLQLKKDTYEANDSEEFRKVLLEYKKHKKELKKLETFRKMVE